jgi:hypothetical protein
LKRSKIRITTKKKEIKAPNYHQRPLRSEMIIGGIFITYLNLLLTTYLSYFSRNALLLSETAA